MGTKEEESSDENMHKKYWSFVFHEVWNFTLKHKIVSLIVIFVLILSVLTYFGYAKYIPEFNFPIGTFKVETDIPNATNGKSTNPDSKKLDRSIFDLSKDTIASGLTSKERVSLISNVSGLETKEETGAIEDIGTDGLSLLIRGNATDGSVGTIRCDFSSNWKQRISLLKKGSEVKFIGTISEYDLSRMWINLNNCRLAG